MAETNKQPPVEQTIILRLNEIIENAGKVRDELASVSSSGQTAQKSLNNVSKSMNKAEESAKSLQKAAQTVGRTLNIAFRGLAFAGGVLQKSIEGPSDALLKFQISSAAGTKSVKNLSASYTEMAKSAKDSISSIQTLAEAMTEFQSKGIAEAVAGGNIQFQKGVKGMQDVLMRSFSRDETKQMLGGFLEGFGDQFATLQDTVERVGETTARALAAGKPEDAVKEYEKAISELGRAIAVSTGDPTPILRMIQTFKAARDEAAGATDGMVRPIRNLNELSNRLSEAWRKVQGAIVAAFGPAISDALQWVNTNIGKLEDRLRNWIEGGGIKKVADFFKGAFTNLGNTIKNVWGVIEPIFTKIGSMLTNLVSGTLSWGNAAKLAGLGLAVLYGPTVLKGIAGLVVQIVKARLACAALASQPCGPGGIGGLGGIDKDMMAFRQWRAGQTGLGGAAARMGMGTVGGYALGAAAGVGGYFAGGAAGRGIAQAAGGGEDAQALSGALGSIGGAAALATAAAGPLAGALAAVAAGLVEAGKASWNTYKTYTEATKAIAENEAQMARVAAAAKARRETTYDPTRAARESIQDQIKALEKARSEKVAEQRTLLGRDPTAGREGKGYELEVAINKLTEEIARVKTEALGGMATREAQFKESAGIDPEQYKRIQDLDAKAADVRKQKEAEIAAIREKMTAIKPDDPKASKVYKELDKQLQDALEAQKKSLAISGKRRAAEFEVGKALAEQKVLMEGITQAQKDLAAIRAAGGDAVKEGQINTYLEKQQKALQDQRDAEQRAREDAAKAAAPDDTVTNALTELQNQYKQAKEEYDKFVAAGEAGTDDYWKKVENLGKQYDQLQTQIRQSGDTRAYSEQMSAIENLKGDIGDVHQAYLGWFKSLKELQGYTGNIQRMSSVMENLGSIVSAMGPGMQVLGQSADVMMGEMSQGILNRAFNTFLNAEKNMALAQLAVDNAQKQAEEAGRKLEAAPESERAKAQEEYNQALQAAGGAAEKLNQTTAEYVKLMQSVAKIPEQIVARERELENMAKLITNLHREDLNISKALYGTPALGVDAQLKIARSLENQKVALAAAAAKQADLLDKTRAQIAAAQSAMEVASTEEERAKLAQRLNLLKGEEWATQKALVQTQTESKRVTVEQLETVKQLRDGYLDAVQAQAFSAGRFEKIIITQEKNVSRAMEKGIAKRNFLLGQVGEDATGAVAEPYRFSAAGYGQLEKPGGGAFTAEDMAKRMDAALKNISDPVQRAAVQQSMAWLQSSQNLAQSYTTASDSQIEALGVNTDAINQLANNMMERRPPPAEAGRGVWGEEATRRAGAGIPGAPGGVLQQAVDADQQKEAVKQAVQAGQQQAQATAQAAQKAVDGMPELKAVDVRKARVNVERTEVPDAQKSGMELDERGMALGAVGGQTEKQVASAEAARKKNATAYDRVQSKRKTDRALGGLRGLNLMRIHDEAEAKLQERWRKEAELKRKRQSGEISEAEYQQEMWRNRMGIPAAQPQPHQINTEPAAVGDEKSSTLSHGQGTRRRVRRGGGSGNGTDEMRDAAESLIAAADIIAPLIESLVSETPGVSSRHAGQSSGGAVVTRTPSGK